MHQYLRHFTNYYHYFRQNFIAYFTELCFPIHYFNWFNLENYLSILLIVAPDLAAAPDLVDYWLFEAEQHYLLLTNFIFHLWIKLMDFDLSFKIAYLDFDLHWPHSHSVHFIKVSVIQGLLMDLNLDRFEYWIRAKLDWLLQQYFNCLTNWNWHFHWWPCSVSYVHCFLQVLNWDCFAKLVGFVQECLVISRFVH